MQPQFVSGSPLLETAWAVGILLVFILIAWLILLGMRRSQRKLEQQVKKPTLSPQLLQSLSKPLFLLVVSQGFILALSSLSYLATWRPILAKVSIAVMIVLATYALTRSGSVLLAWYLRRVRVRQSLIRLIQRTSILLIYVGGLLVLLDYLEISITPMIAGLGLSGLAVALALQPTLSNFFAGTQIVVDRMVHVGDYIELDNGVRGYVVEIGWRSTRVRTSFNNMIIIPNSRLADSVITNYYGPGMELAIMVKAGVSYSSDLVQVEGIALEVAKEVIDELDDAVKTFEPWFGYEEFGESNINFWVWLQAKNWIASFRVKSELIKRLKSRFDQEGITINYPVRHLTFDHPSDAQLPFLSDTPGSGSPRENR
ncbi:mechanosensitive ion channel family protein [Chloroflexota bacterium]